MLKKITIIALLFATDAKALHECVSHAFVPRSITTDLVYVDALNMYRRHHQDSDKTVLYTGSFLYQVSNQSRQLGSAFLLGNGSATMSVAQNPPADVNSAWLGLTSVAPQVPFQGTLGIAPQRKVFGYYGNWYANLDSWWCGLWADVSSAILNVRHTLHCQETGTFANANPGITSISDALSNPSYKYGKFFCGLCDQEKRRTGIDDVQLRFGYNYTWCENNKIGLYAIGTIPTGRKPTAEYIFEPLVGSRHGSAGIGVITEYQFDGCSCDQDFSLTLLSDFNYRYVFSAHECRTFDLLAHGPLSRFLLVSLQTNPDLPLTGINFFTQKINVRPRSTIQWLLALNYEWCNWDLEIGYNLFWKQKERIKNNLFFDPIQTVGIFDLGCTQSCTSASRATIGTFDITSDSTFIPLGPDALNPASALAGRTLTNKVYLAGAADGCWCNCVNWFVGLGGSYEFVVKHDKCNALQYWGIFGKAGISF